MRLDATASVRLDDRWRRALDATALATFHEIAGDLNVGFGYV